MRVEGEILRKGFDDTLQQNQKGHYYCTQNPERKHTKEKSKQTLAIKEKRSVINPVFSNQRKPKGVSISISISHTYAHTHRCDR